MNRRNRFEEGEICRLQWEGDSGKPVIWTRRKEEWFQVGYYQGTKPKMSSKCRRGVGHCLMGEYPAYGLYEATKSVGLAMPRPTDRTQRIGKATAG